MSGIAAAASHRRAVAGSSDAVFVEDARELRSIRISHSRKLFADGATTSIARVWRGSGRHDRRSRTVEFSLVFLAVIASGRCVVPVDPQAPDGERRRMRTSATAGCGHLRS